MLKKLAFGFAVMMWTLCGGIHSAAAQSVYSFGDSLSDTGNVKALTGGREGGVPYYRGRFSNGPIWVDVVSNAVAGSLQRTNPGLVGPFSKTTAGYNFAHAGAVANYADLNAEQALGFSPPGALLRVADPFVLTGQARHFRDQSAPFGGRSFQAGADDIATISIGGNDYINAKAAPSGVTPSIIGAMQIIRQRNIKNFLVLDLPPLGEIPAKAGGSQAALLNQKTREHNASLRTATAAFAAQSGARVEIVPLSALFDAVKDDIDNHGGAAFGFTIGRPGPGTSGNCLEDGLAGAACPRTYVFYDGMHPTTAMQGLIGRLAVARLTASAARAGDPVARVIAVDQSRLPLNALVAARFAAGADGAALSGVYTNGGAGFDAGIGLGFQPTDQASSTNGVRVFRYAAGDVPGFEAANGEFLTESNLGRGQYISGYGADAQISANLFIGAMSVSALRNDFGPLTARKNETRSSAIYALWHEGNSQIGVRFEQGRAEQDFVRDTGFSEAPLARGTARTGQRSVRFDARQDMHAGDYTLSALTALSLTRLDQAGYQELAAFDFVTNASAARSDSGAAAYLGVSASREARIAENWRGSVNLEGGLLAASSDRVGYSALLDGQLLRRSDQSVRFFAPDQNLATTGAMIRARFGLVGAEGFSLDAQLDSLFDDHGGASAGSLRAAYRF